MPKVSTALTMLRAADLSSLVSSLRALGHIGLCMTRVHLQAKSDEHSH